MSKYTLKFTIISSKLSQPVNAVYESSGVITVDLYPFLTTPVDVSQLPLKIDNEGGINIYGGFPEGSLFSNVEYDGSDLHFYDKNGKEIPFTRNMEYNKVTKIIAGENVKSKSSDNIWIYILIFIILFIIGLVYYFFFYNSKSTPENPIKGGLLEIGE
jgi:hypothetical protein